MNDISELDLSRWGKKPHIYFFNGYWRVTPWPERRHRAPGSLELWNRAHLLISRWNNAVLQCGTPSPARQRLVAAWGEIK